MVNVSDIYAMGGCPIAVVDALWSRSPDLTASIWDGMKAAIVVADFRGKPHPKYPF